ncbi:hypothetical protein E2C01_024614 [Portunus trituberculatus]|uniref:Uncharacterized protein n=1 Tax=Portunus trituberculatus TaxID=210409 RepID=A0A5B7ECU1_PORTR|nr:hypothetical protein [Portunus trituberculatus]
MVLVPHSTRYWQHRRAGPVTGVAVASEVPGRSEAWGKLKLKSGSCREEYFTSTRDFPCNCYTGCSSLRSCGQHSRAEPAEQARSCRQALRMAAAASIAMRHLIRVTCLVTQASPEPVQQAGRECGAGGAE